MIFKIDYGIDRSKLISLERKGNVYFSDSTYDARLCGYPTTTGDMHYQVCISTLNAVAERYPEVYRAVYEHIQGRSELEYLQLKDYCKKKNNELARKLTIIE